MNSREIIEEIKQISFQYKSEVDRDRSAWPKAIKDRVAELFEAGVNASVISRETGLAYYTILKWRPASIKKGAARGQAVSSSFKELAIVKENPAVVTLAKKPVTSFAVDGTVTVTTPRGFKIEVQNFELALRFVKDLGGV